MTRYAVRLLARVLLLAPFAMVARADIHLDFGLGLLPPPVYYGPPPVYATPPPPVYYGPGVVYGNPAWDYGGFGWHDRGWDGDRWREDRGWGGRRDGGWHGGR